MAFDPASSSPKPVSQGSRLNLLKNYGPRFYRFHWKLGKMGGYETINKRYGSFILRLKILVITADLFYTDTLLSRKMQLLWPRTIFSAITSDIPRSFAQNSFCGAVIVWERQLLKLEICADAWEIVPAHCHQISLIIQFLSDFVGELLPDCVYECLWTVPLYPQYQRGRWLAAK